MSVGDDIKEVLSEVASSIVILRDSGNIEDEFCDIEINKQATKPFIISFFRKATFQYDTQAVAGDIVEFDTTEDRYIVTTINPEEFENAVIAKQAVLYFCNVAGELQRPAGEGWDDNYHKEPVWDTIKSGCNALLVNPEFRNELIEEEMAMVSMEEDELFLPHSIGAAVGDRYVTVSGENEYYKLEVVNSYRYVGVDVCRLGKDTR